MILLLTQFLSTNGEVQNLISSKSSHNFDIGFRQIDFTLSTELAVVGAVQTSEAKRKTVVPGEHIKR